MSSNWGNEQILNEHTKLIRMGLRLLIAMAEQQLATTSAFHAAGQASAETKWLVEELKETKQTLWPGERT